MPGLKSKGITSIIGAEGKGWVWEKEILQAKAVSGRQKDTEKNEKCQKARENMVFEKAGKLSRHHEHCGPMNDIHSLLLELPILKLQLYSFFFSRNFVT